MRKWVDAMRTRITTRKRALIVAVPLVLAASLAVVFYVGYGGSTPHRKDEVVTISFHRVPTDFPVPDQHVGDLAWKQLPDERPAPLAQPNDCPKVVVNGGGQGTS